MDLYQYLAQAEGGILRDTMGKLARHAQVHPEVCPSDCAFQASIKRLKEQHGIAGYLAFDLASESSIVVHELLP
jgi:hypothetical protein